VRKRCLAVPTSVYANLGYRLEIYTIVQLAASPVTGNLNLILEGSTYVFKGLKYHLENHTKTASYPA
jgi:hypothetical protein